MEEREKEKERQIQREKLEMEERIAKEKLLFQEKDKENERLLQEKEQERQYNLRMKELEMQDEAKAKPLDLGTHFDVTKHIRLVPPFQEKEVETLEKAARLADDYTLTHKVSFVSKANPTKPFYPTSGHKPSPSLQSGNSSQNTPKPKTPGENKGHNPLSQPICNYCKQSGHIVSDCPVLKRKREKQEGLKPTGLTSLKLTPHSYFKDQNPVQAKEPETDCVMEIYEPFLSDGFVSLNSDFAQSTPITILRDTGASQSLILADTLPFSEKTSSGTSVLIQGVELDLLMFRSITFICLLT